MLDEVDPGANLGQGFELVGAVTHFCSPYGAPGLMAADTFYHQLRNRVECELARLRYEQVARAHEHICRVYGSEDVGIAECMHPFDRSIEGRLGEC